MTVYHEGELAVQAKAGVTHMAERVGRGITDNARFFEAFLNQVDLAVAGTVDKGGRVWASPLVGELGFISLIGSQTVYFQTSDEIVVENISADPRLGVLAIDSLTRGRVRLNGRAEIRGGGVVLHTEQVYGNCPKYIQKRDLTLRSNLAQPSVEHAGTLSPELRVWIGKADTFFIASRHPTSGADASHRGGQPGFIEVEGNVLRWPDYQGNMMFNTLGNLHANPNAGLLFIDFGSGDTLQLFGQAAILWDEASTLAFKGAERVVSFTVEGVRVVRGGVPLRGKVLEYSPYNPR